MIRGIRLGVQAAKNNSSVQALVGNRVYPTHIALLSHDITYPCIGFWIETGDRLGNYNRIHITNLQVIIWSEKSYDQCNDILELLIGKDTEATKGVLDKQLFTDENSTYKVLYKFEGGERYSAELDGEKTIYQLSSTWLLDGGDM